jgi:uncharacterized protein YecE (DUF72 family)
MILDGDSKHAQIADPTADFVYARIMGTKAGEEAGYPPDALDAWVSRARAWAGGGVPDDLPLLGDKPAAEPRDVFLYVIAGAKARNPAAAVAMIDRLNKGGRG